MHRARHPQAFLAEGLAFVAILHAVAVEHGHAGFGQRNLVVVAAGADEGALSHRAVLDLELEVESFEPALGIPGQACPPPYLASLLHTVDG